MTRSSKSLIDTVNRLSFSIFVLTFGTQQLGEIFLRTFVQVGEQVERQRKRIELLTGTTETFGKVVEAANAIGMSIDQFAGSFTRLAIANTQMGLTNDQLVQMTKTIVQLGVIGGGTMQEVTSGMQQLAQAFASGKLGGDELRSVMENLPFLAMQMAKEMKVTVGALRDMGAAGEITPKRMSDAFLAMSDRIQKLFEDMPVTSEMGLARISTAWDLMINTMLKAGGVDTVGEAFTSLAKELSNFTALLEDNKVAILEWAPFVTAMSKGVLELGAAWFLVIRPLLGVAAALKNVSNLFAASTAATAALTAATAGLTAGTVSLAAAQEAETAALVAYNAARKAALLLLGGLATAAALVAYAFSAMADAQEKATKAGKEASEQVKKAGPELVDWSRRTLEATKSQIDRNIALNKSLIATKEAAIAALQAKVDFYKDPATREYYRDAWGLNALILENDALQAEQKELQASSDAAAGALKNQGTEANTLTKAFNALSKETQKIVKDNKEAAAALEGTYDRISQIGKLGIDAGEMRASENDVSRAYREEVLRVTAIHEASAKTEGDNNALKNSLDIAAEQLRLAQETLKADKTLADVRKNANEGEKDATYQQREQLRILDAKIAKSKTVESMAMDTAISERRKLEGQVGPSGKLSKDQLESFAHIVKLEGISAKAQAERRKYEKERIALGGASVAMEAADATDASTEAITRETNAIKDNNEEQRKRKEFTKFQLETQKIAAGNLEGVAAVQAKLQEDLAQLEEDGQNGRIANLKDFEDRRMALIARSTKEIIELRQEEASVMANDIYQAMSSSFTAMVDNGEKFHDTLGRIIKSLRDMVVQMTIMKPLSEFLGGVITGATGSEGKSNAALDAGLPRAPRSRAPSLTSSGSGHPVGRSTRACPTASTAALRCSHGVPRAPGFCRGHRLDRRGRPRGRTAPDPRGERQARRAERGRRGQRGRQHAPRAVGQRPA